MPIQVKTRRAGPDGTHQHWLDTPGKNGIKHNDSLVRRFLPDYSCTFGVANNPSQRVGSISTATHGICCT